MLILFLCNLITNNCLTIFDNCGKINNSKGATPCKTVSTSLIKEVIIMSTDYIIFLLKLIEQNFVSSITVTKTMVTVRIKK